MKPPSISALASELLDVKRFYLDGADETEIDVRLQVSNLGWDLHCGNISYDQDHTGFWGASVMERRSNVRELARELIEQVNGEIAMSKSGDDHNRKRRR